MFKMKKLWALAGFTALTSVGVLSAADNAVKNANAPAQQNSADPQNEIPQADILKVSEAFGHFIGRNLNTPSVKFDLDSIIKGMREGAAGKPAPMSEKEYEQMMAKIQEKAFAKLSQDNLKAANEFLEKNAKEANVIVLKPGKLQYLIITEGSGDSVTSNSTPLINYTGRYVDGAVFGSSEDVGGPISVPLDQTIPGFSEGILGMKEGEKRRLFVHPDIGYGVSGHLAPNSLLIFDIEVVKATQPEQSQADADEEDDDLPPLAISNENAEDDKEDMEEQKPSMPSKPATVNSTSGKSK